MQRVFKLNYASFLVDSWSLGIKWEEKSRKNSRYNRIDFKKVWYSFSKWSCRYCIRISLNICIWSIVDRNLSYNFEYIIRSLQKLSEI